MTKRRVSLDVRALSGREEIFRLSAGQESAPAIEVWFTSGPIELRSIAQRWFEEMRRCGKDVVELMHDGCPVACVEDAPFGYVNTFKSHVNVGFFNGAKLEDPGALLQGSGKRMRHVKLMPDSEVDAKALRDLIEAAYGDIRARLREERSAQ